MKNKKIANRMQGISPFHVMDILAQAKELEEQGHEVIHLEVGEPDFTTHPKIKQAAKKAIDDNHTGYTAATGLLELKQKISIFYQQRYAVSVKAENVVITPGASGALQLALSVVVNEGENVLMSDPGYPCNRHFTRLLGANAKSIAVDVSSGYQLTHQLIDNNWDDKTVAVLIASPSNPTGTLINQAEMQKIINVVEKHNGVLLVDEIYQGLVYDTPSFTAAALSQNLFIINSFSKYFSMTGWRLGWMVVPDTYLQAVDHLAQNLFLSPPTISQYAALHAFDDDVLKQLDAQRDELKVRRDFFVQGLKSLGFDIQVNPQGAFYIYANISAFTDDSFTFCEQLLKQSYVAITPGIDFGDYQQNMYVRFAYTQKLNKLQLALDRIRSFLTSYRNTLKIS